MQEYVKHLLDGCYQERMISLDVIYFLWNIFKKKNISLCPETVPRMVG